MKKFLILAALLPLAACVEEGPPNYNERDRRAYNGLQEVNRNDCVDDPHCRGINYRDPNYNHAHHYDEDGYYDSNHAWHYSSDNRDRDTDEPDYNPHDGHDHWARQSN